MDLVFEKNTQLNYLGVMLHATLKDKQAKTLYCAATMKQGIFYQCSTAVENMVSCLLHANARLPISYQVRPITKGGAAGAKPS